nr:hypothetical protein [Tanacetum cinerariifolium]
MRLAVGSIDSEKKEIQEFADWILDIGNGKVGCTNDGESNVVFPDNMLIPETDGDEKAILAPTYEMIDVINKRMLSLLPEFLNGLRMSCIPHHNINLKICTPVMLMCNIDQRAGLCNGTSL